MHVHGALRTPDPVVFGTRAAGRRIEPLRVLAVLHLELPLDAREVDPPLIAGARRLRAAKLAGCTTVPARVLDLDDAAADEASIIENLHREDIAPLDEGISFQRLIAGGRPIDEVAAALGKSKGYVYQRISLTRLVPAVQDLLVRDVLPLVYALKIAVVPAEHQEEALAQCFRPLFREEPSRDQLEPVAQLTAWIERTPIVFCAVSAVMAVMPKQPRAAKVLRSAWMPAPPPESEPAIDRTRG